MKTKRRYDDLFIDFDDTLYDTHGNAQLALVEVFDHFQLNRHFDRLEDFTVPYWKTNYRLWEQYAAGEVTRDFLIVERFRQPLSLGRGLEPTVDYCLTVSDYFLERCSCKPGVIPGCHALLDYLTRRGYRLHLCSNGFHEVQYRKIAAAGLDGRFQTVILSEDAGANKPSPEYFRYAFAQSGAQAGKTLMIGDNIVTDIRGAHAAGIDQLYFNPAANPLPADFSPTYQVGTLAEIQEIL